MTEFAGRTAVVTGGGSGMGRELVRQLVAEACNVAMCDVSPTGLAETQRLCEAAGLPQGLRVTRHIADVADRTQVERFRDEVAGHHQSSQRAVASALVFHKSQARTKTPALVAVALAASSSFRKTTWPWPSRSASASSRALTSV